MPTLNAVRTLIGQLSQPGFLANFGQTGAGTSSTVFTDGTLLADSTRGAGFYRRGWFMRTGSAIASADRVRRIAAYDPATGAITVTPAWTGTPASHEEYEVWPVWNPNDVEAAIVRAQRHMYGLFDVSLAGVANQRQYPLAIAAPWLTRPSQVAAIEIQDGTVSGQYTWPTVPNDRLRQVGSATGPSLTLDLAGLTFASTDTLVVRAWTDFDSYTPLAIPTAVTAAPLDWLAWEAIYELIRTPNRNHDDDLRKRAASEVRKYRAMQPEPPAPLFAEPAPWGAVGAGYW